MCHLKLELITIYWTTRKRQFCTGERIWMTFRLRTWHVPRGLELGTIAKKAGLLMAFNGTRISLINEAFK